MVGMHPAADSVASLEHGDGHVVTLAQFASGAEAGESRTDDEDRLVSSEWYAGLSL